MTESRVKRSSFKRTNDVYVVHNKDQQTNLTNNINDLTQTINQEIIASGTTPKVWCVCCKNEGHCTVLCPSKNAAPANQDHDPASDEFFMAQLLA